MKAKLRMGWVGAALSAVLLFSGNARAQVCATVRIQIEQELTLERQAFDANMRINNGFEDIALSNVNIEVEFTDEAGNHVPATTNAAVTNCLFFIRESSRSGIDNTTDGTVAPSETADIHWLIIPSPGAGGSNTLGKTYYVGATLRYRVRNEDHTTEVSPDYILVKPMPELALDYFLPGEVYSDDPQTPSTIEPAVPFPLGLRVRNIGYGTARNVKLDTGQPKIVDNELGLLVGFTIEESEVNGSEVSRSLQLNYGDVDPQESLMGRWIMTASLSGTFKEFTADISHADELGGRLTSLINETNVKAHIHIHDVLADIPGRDAVRDFLTTNLWVYESEGTDSRCSDMSTHASLAGGTLSLSSMTQGFIYVKLPNPESSDMVLKQVVRSDGKTIHEANAWLSQTKVDQQWSRWFNLFDVDRSNCTYAVQFYSATNVNNAPVLAYIGPHTVQPGHNIGFVVLASDDKVTPQLSTGPLPAGAGFTDNTNGSGLFDWTPTTSQGGIYRIKFTAFDGELADSETITLTVTGEIPPPYPPWWTARGVIETGPASTNDFAAANMGQVKYIASMAWDELNTLPGGAGFPLSFTNADNYTAANIGQLKALAAPFYDRLSMAYPWIGSAGTNDWSIANIGQVKNLFSFDPKKDSDTDGMPDWWEIKYSPALDPNDPSDASENPDSDDHPNLYEYQHNTDPTVSD